MKFNKLMERTLISLVAASGLSQLSSAIDEDISSKSGVALKQYAQGFKRQTTELRQQVAAFSLVGGEMTAYYGALRGAQAARDDAPAQVAAYGPFFEGFKLKARDAAISAIEVICPEDGLFLHDDVIVGDGKPVNTTRNGFIAWLEGRIGALTIVGATGPMAHAISSTPLPRDGDGPEFIRFRNGLVNYVASRVGLYVQYLGLDGEGKPLDNFMADGLKDSLDHVDPNNDLRTHIVDVILKI